MIWISPTTHLLPHSDFWCLFDWKPFSSPCTHHWMNHIWSIPLLSVFIIIDLQSFSTLSPPDQESSSNCYFLVVALAALLSLYHYPLLGLPVHHHFVFKAFLHPLIFSISSHFLPQISLSTGWGSTTSSISTVSRWKSSFCRCFKTGLTLW